MKRAAVAIIAAMIAVAFSAPARAQLCDSTARFSRPIPLGITGSNIKFDYVQIKRKHIPICYAGTLGSLVEDSNSNDYILSNNHVIAGENKDPVPSKIIQPGLLDGGCRHDHANAVAKLSNFVKLNFSPSGENTVDAAIAEVIPGTVMPGGPILNIGVPAGGTGVAPVLGMAVEKMGRTSCLTAGTVTSTGVNVQIDYSESPQPAGTKLANFVNQIMVSPSGSSTAFGAPGDSGSLVVTQASCPQPVALLFAGDTATGVAIVSPIASVLADLNGRKTPNLGFPGGACTPDTADPASASPLGIPAAAVSSAAAIRDRHSADLMKIPGAIGTGIGIGDAPGTADIEVYLKQYTPQAQAAAPGTVEGVQVKLLETGPIVAL
ncbi:MAG: hypothetical protein ACREQI_08115 [Candidatus Binataceae bacterium]